MTQSKLTQHLNKVIEKNREKINVSQDYFVLTDNGGIDYGYTHLRTFDFVTEDDEPLVLFAAMWVIEICPEEFRGENPKILQLIEEQHEYYSNTETQLKGDMLAGVLQITPKTIGEALKQAAYNTCMTYQALEEYYEELIK